MNELVTRLKLISVTYFDVSGPGKIEDIEVFAAYTHPLSGVRLFAANLQTWKCSNDHATSRDAPLCFDLLFPVLYLLFLEFWIWFQVYLLPDGNDITEQTDWIQNSDQILVRGGHRDLPPPAVHEPVLLYARPVCSHCALHSALCSCVAPRASCACSVPLVCSPMQHSGPLVCSSIPFPFNVTTRQVVSGESVSVTHCL